MKSIPILIFFFINVPLFGQYNPTPHYIDSLKALLSVAKADTARIDLLNLLGAANQYEHIDESMRYFTEAIEVAERLDIDSQIGTFLQAAFFYQKIGENPKSIDLLQQVIQKCEQRQIEIHGMAEAFIGMSYQAQGDFEKALYYARLAFLKLESVSEKTHTIVDERGYMAGGRELALCFEKLGQLDSALYYARMSYQRVLHIGYLQSNGLNEQKVFDNGYAFFYCQTCNTLGKVHFRLGNLDSALYFCRLALDKAKVAQFPESIAESQLSLARFYHQTNQPDSAIHYAQKTYEMAKPLRNFILMRESAELLRSAYEKKGGFSNALRSNDLAIAAKDSTINIDKIRQVQVLTLKEEQRQKEIETQRIMYQARTRQYALIGGVFSLLIIAFFLYRNNRQKQKLNEQLRLQKTEIEALNDELEHKVEERTVELKKALDEVQSAFSKGQTTERKRVSADLHDEIGSALSTIAIFSDLAKTKAQKFAPELVNELERIGIKSRDMIQTMRDTIWMLKEDSHQSVWERMHTSSSETLNAKNIILHWQLPNDNDLPNIPFNTKRHLFLAFKEAINNIVKHAEATSVTVETIPYDGGFMLKITDNGKGFDKNNVQKKGNGLYNFEKRMVEIGGTVNIESSSKGTCILFSFPIHILINTP